jgi:hypothetical protein
MNLSKIKNFTFALTLALVFAGASGLSSLPTIQAQVQPRPQHREQIQHREQMHPRKVIMERIEQNAFREGFRSGWADARRGLRPNPWRHQGYRMGDRLQRRDFRVGYNRGFRRG